MASSTSTALVGNEYWQASPQGATVDGTGLALDASGLTMAWGIYQWSGIEPGIGARQLIARLSGVSGEYWIALSDYTHGRWEHYGPLTEEDVFQGYLTGQNYTSPAGNTYIAIIAAANSKLKVEALSLVTATGGPPGELSAYFVISGGPGNLPSGTTPVVNGISLTIEDGSQAYDAGSGELSFRIRLDNVGSHSVSSAGFMPILDNIREAGVDISLTITDDGSEMVPLEIPVGWFVVIPKGTSSPYADVVLHCSSLPSFSIFFSIFWTADHDVIAVDTRGATNPPGLKLMSPDGTVQTMIDCPNYWVKEPAWSPSRIAVAFSSYYDIVVIDASGATSMVTTDGYQNARNYSLPAWSTDGSKLVFCGETASDGSVVNLFRANADGSELVQLTNDAADSKVINWNPCFSPDGTMIIWDRKVQGSSYGNRDIWIMEADGENPLPLTDNTDMDNCFQPNWSRDGSKIVFTSDMDWHDPYAPDIDSIYIMNPDASAQTRLTDGGFDDDSCPCFSPDGTRIVFNRETVVYEVWVVDVDGTDAHQIDATISREPSW